MDASEQKQSAKCGNIMRMRGGLFLILVQLWLLGGNSYVSASKVISNYDYWEDNMASISIDGQADKINTRVKKNPESHIREEGLRIPNLGVPEGPESQVSYAGADSKSNYKAINFGENELNETSIESPGSGSTGKCECLSLNNSCWTKSACIGVASAISVSSLLAFIGLLWLFQIFSTQAAREEHVILKKKLKAQKKLGK